jgi:hypothetical protein
MFTLKNREREIAMHEGHGMGPNVRTRQCASAAPISFVGTTIATIPTGMIGRAHLYRHGHSRHGKNGRGDCNPKPEKQGNDADWCHLHHENCSSSSSAGDIKPRLSDPAAVTVC